jgi:hypothetical protein
MFIPREIFRLIDPQTVSLFLTCRGFYDSVDLFYYKYNVDVATNPRFMWAKGFFKNTVIKIQPINKPITLVNYANIYNLTNSTFIPCDQFKNLKHISFHNAFDHSSVGLNELSNLESIVFGDNFNQQVNDLPVMLKSLTFGKYFNQPVDSLPKTLTSLTFGSYFNQSVDNLPIGFWFTKNIDIIDFW